ncbi:MAG: NAD+ synthase [Planctomycetes bacterium]|nr:NAD+ synthase [Planctomycetota bacterium]
MKIALAQINTTVGDFPGNLQKIRHALEQARAAGVELVVLPEQAVPGYPAEDLLEREDFIADAEKTFEQIVRSTEGLKAGVVVGTLTRNGLKTGKPVYNSAAFIHDGKVLGVQHKTLLPTYDVFDEGRYFQPAAEHRVFDFAGLRLGLAICEDVWNDPEFWSHRLYPVDPVEELVRRGAEILIAISASPFSMGRSKFRLGMLQALARRWGLPLVYVNLVGGNTTLVFDGNSFVLGKRGELLLQSPAFQESFDVLDLGAAAARVEEPRDEVDEAFQALVLGTRDYMHKSGFKKTVLGLSGGIDSALTAVLAARAAGPENVIGVSMPSRYSSEGSVADARLLCERLKIPFHILPIEPMFQSALETLDPLFHGLPADVTEENLQARIRGQILMAISNKFGALLLTTGNKSELAVGYCTLYGDMCGGLAVISDVPKTLVYRLAHYANRFGDVIPQSSIDKPPSAELRPNQTDQDTLPPYDLLDGILEGYIEKGENLEQIAARGYDRELARHVLRLIDRNEYKRKQAPPGLRIRVKAFGPGRRFPIVQKYR